VADVCSEERPVAGEGQMAKIELGSVTRTSLPNVVDKLDGKEWTRLGAGAS
jgi:hypothetical protein